MEDRRQRSRISCQQLRETGRSWCDGLGVVAERQASLKSAERWASLWNACGLQTLAEHMLDADYAAHPQTAGFVSVATAEQVSVFYDEVESWISRAGGEASEAGGQAERACFPTPFPRWVKIDPCPRAHLVAMVAAGKDVARRAVGVLADGVCGPRPSVEHVGHLRRMLAESSATIYFADEMLADGPGRAHRAATAHHLRRAIETLYEFGQLAVMPHLLDRDVDASPPGATPERPLRSTT
ncbi:hypothetical protein [Actinoallomurus sp. NPDC050550]|uniref:hypothetical protein n=1 Tax=Actinoallomurus sp. NPDC050550 TaxID=3154937 RepID=UPI0034102092